MLKFSRYFVGLLFIISGLIKANDPTGFAIKLEEYFVVFGMTWLQSSALFLSVFICAFEIVLGVALLLKVKSNLVAWSLLIMIVFFTWLTGYSAITNKVTDCGCFGDAIKLTPWQSFSKDLILLIFIVIIFLKRKKIQSCFSKRTDIFVLIISFGLSVLFGIYCVMFLPIIDFLPYKVGNHLPTLMQVPPGAPVDSFETRMYYKKDGEIKEFTLKNYPWEDSTWKWVKTESVLIREGYKPKIKDLRLTDADGNDYTEDILSYPAYQLVVIVYDFDHTNQKAFKKINQLAEQIEKKHQLRTIGVTASNNQKTEYYRHELNTPYDFYFCDATTLKTMVRANPGIMLLKNGTVVEKWHYNNLPNYDEFISLLY